MKTRRPTFNATGATDPSTLYMEVDPTAKQIIPGTDVTDMFVPVKDAINQNTGIIYNMAPGITAKETGASVTPTVIATTDNMPSGGGWLLILLLLGGAYLLNR